MPEQKSIIIVRTFNEFSVELIKQTDLEYKGNKHVYQKNPWYLPSTIFLNSFDEIPLLSLDSSYGVSYYVDGRVVMIEFNSRYIVCAYSMDVSIHSTKQDHDFIGKWLYKSQVAIIGFEITVFVKDPYKDIENILKDTGQYPVLLIKNNKQEEYNLEGEWSEQRMERLKELMP
jgi:hypothetical protein